MEVILSANAAIILMLLVVQMLEYVVEWTLPALTERRMSAPIKGPPRAAASPVSKPAVHYDRADSRSAMRATTSAHWTFSGTAMPIALAAFSMQTAGATAGAPVMAISATLRGRAAFMASEASLTPESLQRLEQQGAEAAAAAKSAERFYQDLSIRSDEAETLTSAACLALWRAQERQRELELLLYWARSWS
jgi:hypothetical protein